MKISDPRPLLVSLLLPGLWCSGCVVEVGHAPTDDRGLAVPNRPTVSSSTATSAKGQLQVEAGISVDPGDTFDSPTTLRYGNTETQELYASWSPYQWSEVPGSDERRVGDVELGLRERVLEETEHEPSVAWQVSTEIPTSDAAEGLSNGEINFMGAGIATKDVGEYEVTGFYQLGFLGEEDDSGVDLEHTLAVSAVGESIAGYQPIFELAGMFTPELDDDQVQVTLGAYRRISRQLVLDGGFTVGLTDDAPDFLFFIGLTQSVGYVTPLAEMERR